MGRNLKLHVLALAGAAVLIGAVHHSVAQSTQPPDNKFTGVPRDIDFIKSSGWSQVILQGTAPTDQLIAQTTNERIQDVLLVALSLKAAVTVEYVEDKPKRLKSVALPVNAKEEQGRVLALSFDEKDSYCWATVFDHDKKVSVWTKSAQMQSILEAAVRQSIPVQEFAYDAASMEITRGKVNVELRK
jgi:hypothetical protein